jgi:hypothetical protein
VAGEVRAALAQPGDVESQVGFQNDVNSLLAAVASLEAAQPQSQLLNGDVQALSAPLPAPKRERPSAGIVRIEWIQGEWVKRPRRLRAATS